MIGGVEYLLGYYQFCVVYAKDINKAFLFGRGDDNSQIGLFFFNIILEKNLIPQNCTT